ncbi:MAG: acyl-CoA dehydrogenase family protein [Oscillospiraceae bacterium]|nr:acyl-CoA dehydrogenase family protein [Oscillospiraceae bacterium]
MFQLTEQQKQLQKELRSYVDREILPLAGDLDVSGVFPSDLFRRIGAAGYLDLNFYHQRPGAKYNCLESVIILEELARGLPSLGLSMSPHVQCQNLIALHGADSLKKRVVPGAIRGEQLLGFAISEASGGSDALGIDTTAVFDGDGWVLNGEKCWITNAGAATGYIVAAKSAVSERSRDVSLFYVAADTPGLDDSERAPLIGMNNSPTGTVRLDNCKVPADCLVGRENAAYGLIKVLLNEGRLDMTALAIGTAQSAMECAIRYSSSTGRYGRSLSSYQGISFPVSRMYEKIFVARSTMYHVAALFESQARVSAEVAALKLFASEMCLEVCRSAVQIHGAQGMKLHNRAERCFRDAQMLTISEGSSEVCQIVISGKLYHAEQGGS